VCEQRAECRATKAPLGPRERRQRCGAVLDGPERTCVTITLTLGKNLFRRRPAINFGHWFWSTRSPVTGNMLQLAFSKAVCRGASSTARSRLYFPSASRRTGPFNISTFVTFSSLHIQTVTSQPLCWSAEVMPMPSRAKNPI